VPLIHLQGQLICSTPEERRLVLTLLPAHMRHSLRAPGCLFFEMTQEENPLVWRIEAGFASHAAQESHSRQSAASDWGRATRMIRRETKLQPQSAEILPETAADARALYLLHRAVFGRPEEAQLVDDLRATGRLALSLTARFGRAYLGHCAFSPLAAPFPAWALGPLALREAVRGQGIAETLVRSGIALARERGIQALFVLGDPGYYTRFGFSPKAAQGHQSRYAGPRFQMLNLTGQALPKGPVTHAAPFAALDT
jgi:predicted N-acetyltransferase YhbS/quinol monooxygenase YgiN